MALRWIPALGAENQLVYFGEITPLEFVRETGSKRHPLKLLKPATSYAWRIDTIIKGDTLTGTVWTFSTE